MGVLVVMTAFLFEFTVGAQKVWSHSSGDTASFEQVDLFFNYIEQDLKNMQFSTEADMSKPFYYNPSSYSDSYKYYDYVIMGLISTTTSRAQDLARRYAKTCPVIYFSRQPKAGGDLYRVVINDKLPSEAKPDSTQQGNTAGYDGTTGGPNTNVNGAPSIPMFEFFGRNFSTVQLASADDYFFARMKERLYMNSSYPSGSTMPSVDPEKMGPPLVNNVYSFKIEVSPNNVFDNPGTETTETKGYAFSRPSAVRITLVVYDPSKVDDFDARYAVVCKSGMTPDFANDLQKASRTFTKVIFLE